MLARAGSSVATACTRVQSACRTTDIGCRASSSWAVATSRDRSCASHVRAPTVSSSLDGLVPGPSRAPFGPYAARARPNLEAASLNRAVIRPFSASAIQRVNRERGTTSENDAAEQAGLAANTDPAFLQEYLREVLPAATFPSDLAKQMVTHESWKYGMEGHNRRLAFLGRRVLKTFLTLFLHTHLPQEEHAEYLANPDKVDQMLLTPRMGDRCGRELGLQKVMRWTPAINDGQRGPVETGLFKVRGVCVEALVGATFHQHGGNVAQLLFLSRILPALDTIPSHSNLQLAIKHSSELAASELAFLASTSSPSTPRSDHAAQTPDSVSTSFEGAASRVPPGVVFEQPELQRRQATG